MPARSSMYFVCFSLTRSAILPTWQTVPSSRDQVLVSLSCTITSGLLAHSNISLPSHFQALRAVGSVATMAFHDHFPGNCSYPVSSGILALASCRAWLCRVSGRSLSRHLAHLLLIL